jgi:hypothetical protein
MSTWVRLWEKLTGRPHRLNDSERVHVAAERLRERTSILSAKLDPLIAIAIDFTTDDQKEDE